MDLIFYAWNWISTISQQQATVIGTVLAAVLGFGTLALGHLWNAHLNRRRDRYLFRVEQLNLLSAMLNEVGQISALVKNQIESLQKAEKELAVFSVLNPRTIAVIYPANLAKLHMLPADAVGKLTAFHAALAEHEYNVQAYGGYAVREQDGKFASFNFDMKTLPMILRLDRELQHKANLIMEAVRPLVSELRRRLGGDA